MNELQAFLLEGRGIRGGLVRLEETWQQVIAQHEYPAELRHLLGEAVAATVLLAGTLKEQPQVSLQLQSGGPIELLLVQCAAAAVQPGALRVRGLAQGRLSRQGEPLLGEGRLQVYVERGRRNGFFQGIVPLVASGLDASLETYFQQSEQLPTRLVLRSGADRRIAGLLLQVLPGRDASREVFDEAAFLARTVAAGELTHQPAAELLPRLFPAFTIRLFDARPVLHDCRCTPAHLAGVVRLLGEDELDSLLADQGCVEITCEFCNRAFRYDDDGVAAVLRGETPGPLLH